MRTDKKLALFDTDGMLYDTWRSVSKIIKDKFDYTLVWNNYDVKKITPEVPPAIQEAVSDLFKSAEFYRDLKPILAAQVMIRELQNYYNVEIMTGRDNTDIGICRATRLIVMRDFNCIPHLPGYRKIQFIEDCKPFAYIDDSSELLDNLEFIKDCPMRFLVNRPYNNGLLSHSLTDITSRLIREAEQRGSYE